MAHLFDPNGKPVVHEHIIIRAMVKDPPIYVAKTCAWLMELITKIGMEVELGPYARYLDDPGNRGITSIALIKTSHIAMHVWDEPFPALIQLDVYSCAPLDLNAVLEKLKEFDPVEVKWKKLDRETDLKDIACGTLSTSISNHLLK